MRTVKDAGRPGGSVDGAVYIHLGWRTRSAWLKFHTAVHVAEPCRPSPHITLNYHNCAMM